MFDHRLFEFLPAASRAKVERLVEDHRAAVALAFDAAEQFRNEASAYAGLETATIAKLGGRREATEELGPPRQSMLQNWAAYERALRADQIAWNSTFFRWRREKLPNVVRLQAAAARREEELQNFAFIGSVEDWLRRAAYTGERLKSAKPVAAPAGDARDIVEACRSRLVELDLAWAAAENAPMPVADLRANLAAALDRIADRGEPVLDPRRREGDAFGVEAFFRQMFLRSAAGGTVATGDGGAAFLLWVFRGEVEKRLQSLIPKADAPAALNENQREARLAEIAAARLECERIEEHAVCDAAANGLVIPRRSDCDPRAVLGVDA